MISTNIGWAKKTFTSDADSRFHTHPQVITFPVPIITNIVGSNPAQVRCTAITLCAKVCQWLATGQWFSPDTPVSSTNKTDGHNITEILLKVALNTITLPDTYWRPGLSPVRSLYFSHLSLPNKTGCHDITEKNSWKWQ